MENSILLQFFSKDNLNGRRNIIYFKCETIRWIIMYGEYPCEYLGKTKKKVRHLFLNLHD